MEWAYIFGVVVALATLVFGAFGLHGRRERDHLDMLAQRLGLLEKQLAETERERDRLRDDLDRLREENDWLRRRMIDRES